MKYVKDNEKLAKRTVQIIGFGFFALLVAIQIVTNLLGRDAGIDSWLIASTLGVGVSAEFSFRSDKDKKGRKDEDA